MATIVKITENAADRVVVGGVETIRKTWVVTAVFASSRYQKTCLSMDEASEVAFRLAQG